MIGLIINKKEDENSSGYYESEEEENQILISQEILTKNLAKMNQMIKKIVMVFVNVLINQ